MKLNRAKLAIDVVIALALGLLYTVHGALGLAWHEWLGILIGVGFAVHVAVSWGWVVGVTRRFLTTTPRARFLYVLDVLVLLTMAWAIASGVLISRVAVPGLASAEPLWRATHVPVSYLTLIVVGVHLGMHGDWLLRLLRRLFRLPAASGARLWALRGVAVALFVAGVFSVVVTDAVGSSVRFGAEHGAGPRAGQGVPAGEHQPGQGRGPGRGGGGMGRGEGGGGAGGAAASGANDLTSLLLHLGVVAAFAVPTYYADALVSSRRRARRGGSARP